MTDTTRIRLDQLTVNRGLAESRSRARAMIEAGLIHADGEAQTKPGRPVLPDTRLEIVGEDHPWASRGGLKLVAALDRFEIDPRGAVALDLGASTGGFTDVLLARGATQVYAVDVGAGQLVSRLRDDARVIVLEHQNARALGPAEIPQPVNLIVCDVSFIGLETALPAALALAAPGCFLVALIKPQFEVGPGKVGKGGIVRDEALHDMVCRRIDAWLGAQPSWQVLGLMDSPVHGSDGNKEFLICARLAA